MMRAPGEKSEMAELMEMVQNDADSSHPPSPRAIQSALAIAKPEKVAKSVNSWSRRVGLVAVPRNGFPCVSAASEAKEPLSLSLSLSPSRRI
jgi:hypothetical protein